MWKPDYITAPELRNWMRLPDDLDDAELAIACTSASRAIDDHTNRQFGSALGTRTYRPWYAANLRRWVVTIDDLTLPFGLEVVVDGVTLSTDDYQLAPVNAAEDGMPYTLLILSPSLSRPCEVSITATWGWSSVPVPVQMAARIQAHRFAIRRESPYGTAGNPAQGTELRLLSRLDPDVAVSLRGFCRTREVG